MNSTSDVHHVTARTAPISSTAVLLSRLTAGGADGDLRLQACLESSSEGGRWRMHRYLYRLWGGEVRADCSLSLELVSDGSVVYEFDTQEPIVNDGRWYIHEHTTLVPKAALTYARFEGGCGLSPHDCESRSLSLA